MQKNNRNKKNNTPAIDLTAGYNLPQANDIERTVLGAMLLESSCIMDVKHFLKSADFYKTEHQHTFTSIIALYEKGIIPDIYLVLQDMIAKGTSDFNTAFSLTSYTKDVVSAANIRMHCLIIKQKAIARKLLEISVKAATGSLNESSDVFEIIAELERELEAIQNELIQKKETTLESITFKMMQRFADKVQLARDGKEDPNSVFTGIADWDRMNGSLFPGGIYVLAARPGMGKTAMVIELIKRICEKYPAGFFNLEMTEEQIVKRLASSSGRIDNHLFSKEAKYVTDDEMQKLYNVLTAMPDTLNLHIDLSGEIQSIRNKIRYWKATKGCRVFFIDYLQIISVSEEVSRYMTDVERINYVLEKLRHIALEQEVTIFLLSQLNREGYKAGGNKEPNMSHLKGSGKIEEIAYQVAFLHRPEYYDILEDDLGESTKGLAYVIVAKHRDGALGRFKMKFTPQFSAFDNWVDPLAEVGWQPTVASYSQMGVPFEDDEEATPF